MNRFSDLDHESRFQAVLSSVNTEFKSVTLGFCLDEYWKSCVDLRDSYYSFVEGSNVRIPSADTTFSNYCHQTFLPIGLIVEEKIEIKEPFKYATYWKLTEEGLTFGQPSAALAIKTAKDFDLSLYSVLGPTSSKGVSRSPYNRAEILMELDIVREARIIDLSNSLGLDTSAIFYHCKNLSKIGFIKYESVGEGKGWANYKWIKGKKSENVKPIKKYRDSSFKVAKLMEENPKAWNCHNIAEKADYKDVKGIGSILTNLEKQKFVKRVGKFSKFKCSEKRSEARITERGRRFVNSFLKPVHDFLCPNADETILEDFGETYQHYLDNPGLLRSHIIDTTELYSSTSPHLRSRPTSLTQAQMVSLIKKNKKMRPVEIENALNIANVRVFLTSLIKRKILKKERKGVAVYYSLVKND